MAGKSMVQLLKYDSTMMLRQNLGRLFGAAVVQFFLCGIILASRERPMDVSQTLYALLWGCPEYAPSSGNDFVLPVAWLVIVLYALFIAAAILPQALAGSGPVVLMKTARRQWWLSKCICISGSIVLYFFMLYGIAYTLTLVFGGGAAEGFGQPMEMPGLTGGNLLFLCLPPLICISMALVLAVLSLFLKPMAGYTMSVVFIVVSVYFKNQWLLGNYGMLARIRPFSKEGLSPEFGCLLAVLFMGLAVAAGTKKMERLDLL